MRVEPLTSVFPFSARVPPVMEPPAKVVVLGNVSVFPELNITVPPLNENVLLKVGCRRG